MSKGERLRGVAAATNARVLLAAGIGVVVGVFALWSAARDGWGSLSPTWGSVVSNVGGLVVATSVLALLWELAGKRAFATEVMATANLSTDVVHAGLRRVTNQYLEDVAWADLFEGASKVDIVVAYASTWRNTHRGRLGRVAKRGSARIRVFLPDPDDDMTMRVLADRFSMTPPELQSKIREAIRDFSALAVESGTDLRVFVRAGDAVFSCYRFDGRAVLTLYSHARVRRSSVPTLVVQEGDLFSFVYDEIKSIAEQSRQVFPQLGGSDAARSTDDAR